MGLLKFINLLVHVEESIGLSVPGNPLLLGGSRSPVGNAVFWKLHRHSKYGEGYGSPLEIGHAESFRTNLPFRLFDKFFELIGPVGSRPA
ncbi:MAG: hypothetical protein D4R65_16020 [Verrucomicrobiaceae bacterium]|nr:MAG: hypothetical protein D4R65_16020 [Verrucomicrobiaceae bacterium]